MIRRLCEVDDRFRVLHAPLDVDLAADTVVQPALGVGDPAEFDDEAKPVRPLLVVEIPAPSSRRVDQVLKRERYQRTGVPAYWIVDPGGPSATVLELREGEYAEVGSATGEETIQVELPAPLTLRPATWLA